MLVFTYFHPHGRVLWLPFQWNVLFIGINAYRIGRTMYYEYRGIGLSEEMKAIKRDFLDVTDMDLYDFAKLVDIAVEETFEVGDMAAQQGQENPYIRLVIEGKLDCFRDGIATYSLEKGNFISEGGLHAGLLLDGTIESCCSIVAVGNDDDDDDNEDHKNDKRNIKSNGEHKSRQNQKQTRCLRWNRSELVDLLQRESGIKRSLKAALSWDIVRKLKGQRESITEHKVSDAELWTMKRKEQSEDRYASIVRNVLTTSQSAFGIDGSPSSSTRTGTGTITSSANVDSLTFNGRRRRNSNRRSLRKRALELEHYRTIHHIDDEHHELALKKIGWTLEEYDARTKLAS